MVGSMFLTTFEILAESSLFKPDSEIKNIGIICPLVLEFLAGHAFDLECGWDTKIVRMCDDTGINLDKELRKQYRSVKRGWKTIDFTM